MNGEASLFPISLIEDNVGLTIEAQMLNRSDNLYFFEFLLS